MRRRAYSDHRWARSTAHSKTLHISGNSPDTFSTVMLPYLRRRNGPANSTSSWRPISTPYQQGSFCGRKPLAPDLRRARVLAVCMARRAPFAVQFSGGVGRDLVSEADLAVTVSPQLAAAMAAEYGREFITVPNCASLDDARGVASSARSPHGRPGTIWYFYFGAVRGRPRNRSPGHGMAKSRSEGAVGAARTRR